MHCVNDAKANDVRRPYGPTHGRSPDVLGAAAKAEAAERTIQVLLLESHARKIHQFVPHPYE